MYRVTSRLPRRPFRRPFQPRSVLSLVLSGYAVVGLPLAVGLIISSHQIDTLSGQSEALLRQAVDLSQATRAVLDRLASVERAARQWLILEDSNARDTYRTARIAFRDQVDATAELGVGAAMGDRLAALAAREAQVAESVAAERGDAGGPSRLSQQFRELDALGQALARESETQAAQAVEHLQQLGQRAQSVVFWQFVIVLALASLLALAFTLLITRPIGALDRAIRSLADARGGRIAPVAGPRDLRALSVRLESVRRKLRQTDRERQRLLGQVSHELKTPLSAIREGVSLLHDRLLGPVTERQQEVIGILEANAERLQTQIETLLRYNRLRTGLQPATRRRLDVAELVDEVLAGHALTIAARSLQVELDVEAGMTLHGDPDMMKTILNNLVSNAIKFSSRRGRVNVCAGLDGDRAVIEIADQGPGIEPGDRARIFEPFYRGGGTAESPMPGTGLGLAICRDLARAHGGDVEVRDRAEWRTVFRVSLPIDGTGQG